MYDIRKRNPGALCLKDEASFRCVQFRDKSGNEGECFDLFVVSAVLNEPSDDVLRLADVSEVVW